MSFECTVNETGEALLKKPPLPKQETEQYYEENPGRTKAWKPPGPICTITKYKKPGLARAYSAGGAKNRQNHHFFTWF